MPKSANQKWKLLVLYRFLLARTDDDHPVTVQEMQDELTRWDISAERKSIYNDMEELRQLGVDVQSRKGKHAGWFIGQREFELAAQTLSRELEQTRRELQSKGKLNSALGVLGGVILVILFI